MKIFAKILQSQESGYSKDKPNQRGKYILIPKEAWDFFPDLSSSTRNSFCTLRFNTPDNKALSAIYVWNNTKYFPRLGLKRAHDERRIYRTTHMETSLGLDREVIIFFIQFDDRYIFNLYSLCPSDSLYENFYKILSKNKSEFLDFSEVENIDSSFANKISRKNSIDNTDVDNFDELLPSIMDSFKKQESGHVDEKKSMDYLGEKVIIDSDPLIALSASFKTQNDFKNIVRNTYKFKCALRREALVSNDGRAIGLEAAHIHAKVNGGNFLPSNGILLSEDLHAAFDEGYWTLNDDLSVRVHDQVTSGKLLEFNGKKLYIPPENVSFAPYIGYLRWHQENRFGLFVRNVN